MAIIIISCAILALALAVLSISKQKVFLERYVNNFAQVINEAKQVQQDLTELMDNAVSFSENMVNNIVTRETKEKVPQADVLNDIHSYSGIGSPRIRVYQLAREMGISSFDMIQRLKGMGIPVDNHMNCIDRTMVNEILQNNTNLEMFDNSHIIKGDTSLSNNATGETKESVPGFTIEELQAAHPYIAVRNLHEKGYSVKDIAKILGRGQGEIQLILNLARKSEAV